MKIIDFDRKGNVVRFYLGDDTCDDYWGDDWDDVPYEHNAGKVYDRYIKGYKDISFPFNNVVLEPCDGEYNSSFSKKDMKSRKVPCIIATLNSETDAGWEEYRFLINICKDNTIKFYFGDKMEPDVLVQTE